MYMYMYYACTTAVDEAKVLEQVIRDTEQISLEDEEEGGEEGGEAGEGEGEKGSGLVIEPGSAAALLEEFIGRYSLYTYSLSQKKNVNTSTLYHAFTQLYTIYM